MKSIIQNNTGTFVKCTNFLIKNLYKFSVMNTKNFYSVIGISIVALLTISVISISEIPIAMAKPVATGQPDFIAIIDTPNNPGHHNGEKGRAMFWVDAEDKDDENMQIAYKIVLNKIDVGEIGSYGTGQDGNKGKGLVHYLWKLHIHPAPDEVHDATKHYFNIVGPADDDDLKISGNTLQGIWDKADWSELENEDHESNPPVEIIAEMCSEDMDINVHTETHLQVRGQIIPNSNFCESFF